MINSSGWSLATSNHQKHLPTRTFRSLLNAIFFLLPQPYNNNMAKISSHQEIPTSCHGNNITHTSCPREILTSRHGNSLQHQHQTRLAHGLTRQQTCQNQTRWHWQRQKQGKQLVLQRQRIRGRNCLVSTSTCLFSHQNLTRESTMLFKYSQTTTTGPTIWFLWSKNVLGTPCNTPLAPELSFEL